MNTLTDDLNEIAKDAAHLVAALNAVKLVEKNDEMDVVEVKDTIIELVIKLNKRGLLEPYIQADGSMAIWGAQPIH